MGDELIVRITAVGHASRRWRGAKNAAEADHLNLALSEKRAQNVRQAVEAIIKRELPSIKIEVPSKGVGSREPFPTAGEDNAAVDRSVVVMVELTTTNSTYKFVPRPPRKIYTPSKLWTLRVESMTSGGGLGPKATLLRIKIRNPHTGKELGFSGGLTGGALGVPTAKNIFKFDKADPSKFGKPVGQEVTFTTKESMDFDDWIGRGKDKGQVVRLTHSQIKSGLTNTETTFLQFTGIDHDPDMLVFDLTKLKLKLGIPDFDLSSVAGKLTADGGNPGDNVMLPSPADIVPIRQTHPYNAGLLVSFPTGKATLQDLDENDRKELTNFVTIKAHAIAAFAATSYKVSTPNP